MVAVGRSSTDLESHFATVCRLAGHAVETHAFLLEARPATKEETANQYGHSQENYDHIFHLDTFVMVKTPVYSRLSG